MVRYRKKYSLPPFFCPCAHLSTFFFVKDLIVFYFGVLRSQISSIDLSRIREASIRTKESKIRQHDFEAFQQMLCNGFIVIKHPRYQVGFIYKKREREKERRKAF